MFGAFFYYDLAMPFFKCSETRLCMTMDQSIILMSRAFQYQLYFPQSHRKQNEWKYANNKGYMMSVLEADKLLS